MSEIPRIPPPDPLEEEKEAKLVRAFKAEIRLARTRRGRVEVECRAIIVDGRLQVETSVEPARYYPLREAA